MSGIILSDEGFDEAMVAAGCAAAILVSWIVAVILIFFPRHQTETYRRRLVANMPRARDETLPTELQLQSTIDSISMTNAAASGQSQVDTATTKDEEAQIPQDEPFEDGGSLKNSTKDETKDQKKPDEKKSKPEKDVPKAEQQLEKPGKKKVAAEKKPEKPIEKKQEKPAEKKSGKGAEKKDDKKGKEEKPKEKDKKKK